MGSPSWRSRTVMVRVRPGVSSMSGIAGLKSTSTWNVTVRNELLLPGSSLMASVAFNVRYLPPRSYPAQPDQSPSANVLISNAMLFGSTRESMRTGPNSGGASPSLDSPPRPPSGVAGAREGPWTTGSAPEPWRTGSTQTAPTVHGNADQSRAFALSVRVRPGPSG